MAKDPRFNFYPDNYEGGTEFFSLEEDGAYLRLLMLQFRQGTFTEKQAVMKLMQRCPETPEKAKTLWAAVRPKFEVENGNFWNTKLRCEIEKSLQFSDGQSDRAKNGWKKRKGLPYATALPNSMPDESPKHASISSSNSSIKTNTSSKKNRAVTPEQTFDFLPLIPSGWDADHFQKLVAGWLYARRKKPATEYAKELAITALIKYLPKWEDARERMERAIKGGWLDLVFKEDKENSPQTVKNGKPVRDKL